MRRAAFGPPVFVCAAGVTPMRVTTTHAGRQGQVPAADGVLCVNGIEGETEAGVWEDDTGAAPVGAICQVPMPLPELSRSL